LPGGFPAPPGNLLNDMTPLPLAIVSSQQQSAGSSFLPSFLVTVAVIVTIAAAAIVLITRKVRQLRNVEMIAPNPAFDPSASSSTLGLDGHLFPSDSIASQPHAIRAASEYYWSLLRFGNEMSFYLSVLLWGFCKLFFFFVLTPHVSTAFEMALCCRLPLWNVLRTSLFIVLPAVFCSFIACYVCFTSHCFSLLLDLWSVYVTPEQPLVALLCAGVFQHLPLQWLLDSRPLFILFQDFSSLFGYR